MSQLTNELLKQLAGGTGTVLAAALVLAPGGAVLYWLRERRVLRIRGTADWTAWAAAAGLLANVAVICALRLFNVAPPIDAVTGEVDAGSVLLFSVSYLVGLLLLTGIGALVLATGLSIYQNWRTVAASRRAAEELERACAVQGGQRAVSESVSALILRYLRGTQRLVEAGWRVRLTAGKDCSASGIAIAVPALGEDLSAIVEGEGVLLRCDDGTLSFFAWSSLTRVDLLPGSIPGQAKTFLLRVVSGNTPERNDLLVTTADSPRLERARTILPLEGPVACYLLEEADGRPPRVVVELTIESAEWKTLAQVAADQLHGASSTQITIAGLSERVIQLSAHAIVRMSTDRRACLILRRTGQQELQVIALVEPPSGSGR